MACNMKFYDEIIFNIINVLESFEVGLNLLVKMKTWAGMSASCPLTSTLCCKSFYSWFAKSVKTATSE